MTIGAVVDRHGAVAARADQELYKAAMGVLSKHIAAQDIKDHEEPSRSLRLDILELRCNQASSRIAVNRGWNRLHYSCGQRRPIPTRT